MLDQTEKIADATAAQFFWYLQDFNAIPVITWGSKGEILTVNDAYLDLIGYSRDDFEKGRINWKEITPKNYLPLDEKCIKELEHQEIATVYEKEYVRKDGSNVKVRLYNARAQGSENQCVAAIIKL
jgi:PAS domain S-box-containing protein